MGPNERVDPNYLKLKKYLTAAPKLFQDLFHKLLPVVLTTVKLMFGFNPRLNEQWPYVYVSNCLVKATKILQILY